MTKEEVLEQLKSLMNSDDFEKLEYHLTIKEGTLTGELSFDDKLFDDEHVTGYFIEEVDEIYFDAAYFRLHIEDGLWYAFDHLTVK